jgi:hypothetical protein
LSGIHSKEALIATTVKKGVPRHSFSIFKNAQREFEKLSMKIICALPHRGGARYRDITTQKKIFLKFRGLSQADHYIFRTHLTNKIFRVKISHHQRYLMGSAKK